MTDLLTAEQKAAIAAHMTIRLARLASWIMFFMAHLAAWLLALTLLWWFQVSPASIASAFLKALESHPAQIASAFGLSFATVAVGYWKVATWVARQARHGWLKRYVTKGYDFGS